ncbi:hypothetical protein FORMB_16750 [Formosa sp. Hel1_33_131]|uniref:phage tail protein n=1 Tax=Formosa sp. Hel1_33_131 TaxID=1336794 RepID=UPI00084E34FE|nr:phage tail protein [Formosa sp. Hel1_33_131]AOR28714.1 hypothetical protein FORMB_16750 [Formosa sp. Hel1_33_131]
MKVYRGTSEIIDVVIDNKTQLKQTLQGEDFIQCNFTMDIFFNFKIGDYVNWRNKRYTIFKQPSEKKVQSNQFQYSIDFESDQYRLINSMYLLDGQGEFYLVGDLQKFTNLIIVNLNRLAGDGYYQLATMPSTDAKNLNFTNNNCLNVLQNISKEFNKEFYFSDDGKTIHFADKIGSDLGLSFEFKNGLRNIERQKLTDQNLVTRLYAFGGTRNVTNEYGSKRLKLPNSDGYIEQNTSLFGMIEGVVNFEDVYPHREGTVTALGDDIFKFNDNTIDFDVNNQLIDGVTAKLTFNTGLLAGYEFEITQFTNSSKEFVIIQYEDTNGLVLPNDDLKPQVDDKYVLHDIEMPQSYIDNAEQELLTKANEYLSENSLPNVIYNIVPDYPFLRKNLIQLNIGDIIEVSDADFGVSFETRVISFTQSIANPYLYSMKVGDKVSVGYITRVLSNQLELQNSIAIERFDRTVQYNQIRRNLRNIDELRDSLFDPDGYFDTDNIRPLSIETSMLTVGSKGQQFIIRNLLIEANYESNPNKVRCGNGTLVHFTINDDSVKEWNLTGNIVVLDTPETHYYIYAKCVKDGNNGLFEISTTQYNTEESDYYYFLIGVVHSVVDDVRGISLTYGQTTINGKFITTGRVQSIDGLNYFDLDSNQLKIGNSQVGMDWNVTNPDKLTIRGGLVQSPAGDVFPIAVYRGEYDPAEYYYLGDQVSYNGSTYIFSSETPQVGKAPTNTDYWDVSAEAGASGDSIAIQYSIDGTNWHNPPFQATDIYMRQRVGSGSWSAAIQIVGEDGSDGSAGTTGNYIDYVFRRYPVNFVEDGFIAVSFINNIYTLTGNNPVGWFDAPSEGTDPLWMSKALKDADGNLLESWSTPVRISGNNGDNGEDGQDGQDGANGQDGNDGPGIVYRGVFNQSTLYYNNDIRRDVVKYNDVYYLYNGTNGVALAWSDANWETFGAQFESVATNLLLAENANIADWIIKDGKITSQNEYNGTPRAQFDGANGKLTLVSPMTTYTNSGGTRTYEHTLKLDSTQGRLEARHTGDSYQNSGVSYVDSEGVFANFAGTQALPASSGVEIKGAVVGLGFGKLNRSAYGGNNAIAGVVGRASNSASDPAPAYGGLFFGLKTYGLFLNVKTVTGSSHTISGTEDYISCYYNGTTNVYLPTSSRHIGRMIYVKRINGGVTVHANGVNILTHTQVSSVGIADGDCWFFVYDGSYWCGQKLVR